MRAGRTRGSNRSEDLDSAPRGVVSEWSKERDWKSRRRVLSLSRGFESLPLRRGSLRPSQIGVELQAVAVRIADVELTCAPGGVGDLGAVGKPLGRTT